MTAPLASQAPGAVLTKQTLVGAGGSGSAVVFVPPGSTLATLVTTLEAAPGGSVAWTIAEVNPIDQSTVVGASQSGTQTTKSFQVLSIALVGVCVLVTWTNTGTNTSVDAFVAAQAGGGGLPAGASTSTNQATEIADLASIIAALAASGALGMPQASVAVTPSDSTVLAATKGLWVGTGGDLAVKLAGDSSSTTWKNVASGTFVPGSFIRVMAATTAAAIVALS